MAWKRNSRSGWGGRGQFKFEKRRATSETVEIRQSEKWVKEDFRKNQEAQHRWSFAVSKTLTRNKDIVGDGELYSIHVTVVQTDRQDNRKIEGKTHSHETYLHSLSTIKSIKLITIKRNIYKSDIQKKITKKIEKGSSKKLPVQREILYPATYAMIYTTFWS